MFENFGKFFIYLFKRCSLLLLLFIVLFCFETGSNHVTKAGLELMFLTSQELGL
jgi:hypothetical protein